MTAVEKRCVGNTAVKIDSLGFGCASLGNLYHTVSDAESGAILEAAWNQGYRYFDTAPHYGQGLSERRVGDLLRQYPNDDYVLSSKVGRLLKPAGYAKQRHGFLSPMPFDFVYDYSYDGIMRSFEDSLQRLGLDRIDILYMHDIGTHTHGDANAQLFPIAMRDGYRAMDELRADGRVAAIGLGVNEYQVCEAALDFGDWDCFLLAGRYTLLEQGALESFLPACVARNCSVVIGGAYNSGILATGVQGNGPWHYDYGPAPEDIVRQAAAIESVCSEYGVPLPAAALQFPLAHPAVASVIPGIDRIERVAQTRELFETSIPVDFWQTLIDRSLLAPGAATPEPL